jgi:hypothetical protein
MVAMFAVLVYIKLTGAGDIPMALIIAIPLLDLAAGVLAISFEDAKREEFLKEVRRSREGQEEQR